jgi:hypothetical protein
MADQSAMSTPIFDELLGEMTPRDDDPSPPSRDAVRTDPAASDGASTQVDQ